MITPKISIITPSFNQGKYLEETILSVINQNYANLEYIIIDGGSKDNSVEIINKYSSHLSYWISEKDRGQSDAINKGFKKATGDIIGWLNSDDILIADSLHKISKYFQENRQADVVNGYLLIIDEHSEIISNYFILRPKRYYAQHGIYYVAQPSMFWKRDVLNRIGPLREDFHASMDREFLIRMLKNNVTIGHLNKILAGFRMHSTSKSSAGWQNTDYLRDLGELKKLYGEGYGGRPKMLVKTIYRLEKLVKGIYFKKWLFTRKWKGRHANELDFNNCKYL